jgi:hypothetical protein
MGVATALRLKDRAPADQMTSRLTAIRAIIDLAEDDEDRAIATDELLVLGVSRQELTVAMFDDPC